MNHFRNRTCDGLIEENKKLKIENKDLKDDLEKMIEAFKHYDVSNGINGFCKKCGLYLTHPVHIRE